jgi:hypothetical protein
VLLNLIFEITILFSSESIEFVDLLLVVFDLSGLGVNDSGHDSSSWVEVTFEFSFKLDSLGGALSDVFIVLSDVEVAG